MGFNKVAQAATFNITPLDFGDGFVATGTITTDDTIGALTADNLTSWNIMVTDGIGASGFTFTETNSRLIGNSKGISTDGNQLNVAFPNGVLQFNSLTGNPAFADYTITLARFDLGRNSASYSNSIDFVNPSIDGLADSATYVAGELASTLPPTATTPEPTTLFALAMVGGSLLLTKRVK
ncbi:PEP-CTERM sorting domain-containing protein [Dapis sp. BLCC M126]|uniref:PEP-CTERM sorting domain-containing protein n=1 Tax=Dapis sp. BLCC M126 TaxID=3400189 RepID=UPI003CFA23DA